MHEAPSNWGPDWGLTDCPSFTVVALLVKMTSGSALKLLREERKVVFAPLFAV